ncbi:hypothetical protein MNBD_NITROSPIRAE01-2355 [hydrothermal vent metagenome]|uniref:Transporter n=1 Tax=hydrothermal vent metagenome TaxID=652676 RepID=A0A3B1CNZ6_9ZZZZ
MFLLIHRPIFIGFLLSILSFSSLFLTSKSFASCGAGNCFLVTGAEEGISSPGQMSLDISYRYVPMDDFQKGSGSTNEALVPKVDFENKDIENRHHREIRTLNELVQVNVGYGVTTRFTLQVAIPLMNNRAHEHFDGVTTTNPDGNFTRDDGASGIGDIRLMGRYAAVLRTRHLVVIGGGVKFPTGEYKLLNGEGNINEPSIQPGTGSFDYLFSFFYDYQILPHRFDTFVSLSYELTDENNLGYTFGDQTLFNLGFNYRLESEKNISLSTQFNLRHTDRDTFETNTGGTGVLSTGGTTLYFSSGIRIQASDTLGLYSFLQLPVYQYVNEENLVAKFGLVLGVTYTF